MPKPSPLTNKVSAQDLLSPLVVELDGSGVGKSDTQYITALFFGGWLIYWDDSGLCIPKRCIGTAVHFAADSANIGIFNMESAFKVLSHVIQHWNNNICYRKNSDNAQTFLDFIMKHLRKYYQIKYPHYESNRWCATDLTKGRFFEEIRKNGSVPLVFYVGNDFRKVFNYPPMLKNDVVKFSSQLEMADWIQQIYKLQTYWDDYKEIVHYAKIANGKGVLTPTAHTLGTEFDKASKWPYAICFRAHTTQRWSEHFG
eukprot:GEZU01018903.1.p1 GENE.GEZU01018903.1~~GEZU01018903.1.p1  ORF type:complete len:299 (-),score=21.24 GEZU01018903.1:157-924(-)